MSKSVKNRHDKYGTFIKLCGGSNKKDKIIANRKFRRYNRMNLLDPENSNLLYDMNEVSDPWAFSSDGLAYYINLNRCKYSSEPFSSDQKRKFRAK